MPYQRVDARGLRFLFKLDDADPELLHIYARHLTNAQDALDTFFDPEARSIWNERFRRFETTSSTHVLYWF